MGVIENIEGNCTRTIALRREHNIHTIASLEMDFLSISRDHN